MSIRLLDVSLVLVLLIQTTTLAGDWPQILGPNRDGVAAADEIIASQWSESGPPVLWSADVGQGLAGPAVADGVVYLFHREGDSDILQALDLASGEIRWEYDYETTYRCGYHGDSGPRCVPVVRDARVYIFGAGGQLSCVNAETGEELWSRPTWEEFEPPEGFFGAGSTPILVDGLVIVNVGARGAGIVAFDAATGETKWQRTDELASYSSPVLVETGARPYVVFVTRFHLMTVVPETGEELSAMDFGERGATVNAASPLLMEGNVFVTASYGIGAKLVRLNENGQLKEAWSRPDLAASQYVTPILYDGAIFSMNGRDDVGTTHLVAFDPVTGREHWSKEKFGTAAMILADAKLVMMKTDGELVLLDANKQMFRQLGSHRLFAGKTRALPALAQGRLFVRDHKQLRCVDLR